MMKKYWVKRWNTCPLYNPAFYSPSILTLFKIPYQWQLSMAAGHTQSPCLILFRFELLYAIFVSQTATSKLINEDKIILGKALRSGGT